MDPPRVKLYQRGVNLYQIIWFWGSIFINKYGPLRNNLSGSNFIATNPRLQHIPLTCSAESQFDVLWTSRESLWHKKILCPSKLRRVYILYTNWVVNVCWGTAWSKWQMQTCLHIILLAKYVSWTGFFGSCSKFVVYKSETTCIQRLLHTSFFCGNLYTTFLETLIIYICVFLHIDCIIG